MYSATVRRLVAELPNEGRLVGAAFARVENPICGDVIDLYLRIENDVIRQSVFQATGCPAAIAAAAAISLMAEGKALKDAALIDVERLLEYLDGLPSHKRHGAEMAIRALRQAAGMAGGGC